MRGVSIAQRDVLRGLERAEAFLRRAVDAGAGVVTFAAPRARDVAALWDEEHDALLWHPAGAPPVAGLGFAAELAPRDVVVGAALDGSAAREASREGAADGRAGLEGSALDGTALDGAASREIDGRTLGEALGLSRAEVREPGLDAPALAAYGGLAFDPDATPTAPWAAFGAGLFVVPRWSYGHGAEGAWLRVVLGEGERIAAILGELRLIWARLEVDAPSPPAPRITRRDDASEEAWRAYVVSLTDAIARGEAVKVVAALAARLGLEGPVSPRTVLEALRRRFPGCTRFALRRSGTTFLGATPERLVERRGERFSTEALAGSAPVGGAATLRASAKDRHEHALVVDAITTALAPFATQVTPGAPFVRELPNVVHLSTPIDGTLRGAPHVLALVRALHPTPAVCGVPREAALGWIAEREPALLGSDARGARGWYAAPFGTFDASGDGEFVVALRSGVLVGDRVFAYAGCGVVAGSEPESELAEARLKLDAFLSALGGG